MSPRRQEVAAPRLTWLVVSASPADARGPNRFLGDPGVVVPGTGMISAGRPASAAHRNQVLDFIASRDTSRDPLHLEASTWFPRMPCADVSHRTRCVQWVSAQPRSVGTASARRRQLARPCRDSCSQGGGCGRPFWVREFAATSFRRCRLVVVVPTASGNDRACKGVIVAPNSTSKS